MIVTFYSFKGGVGRSMSLVNVGELLADMGYRVLLCDWDLEAPGLERYVSTVQRRGRASYRDEQAARELVDSYKQKPGLVDLLRDYMDAMRSAPAEGGVEASPDFEIRGGVRVRRPSSYAVPVEPAEHKRDEGSLRLLTAGRRDGAAFHAYASFLQSFSWNDFYERWGGAAYLEFFRKDLERDADVVLIDSRTGVTEHGGVCTHHLADLVVLLTAPNHMNLEGTKWMAGVLQRYAAEARPERPLRVLPVASRVEISGETDLLGEFRQLFEDEFQAIVPDFVGDRRAFLGASEIPYKTVFAFAERVVTAEQNPDRELFRAYTTIAETIARAGLEAPRDRGEAPPADVAPPVKPLPVEVMPTAVGAEASAPSNAPTEAAETPASVRPEKPGPRTVVDDEPESTAKGRPVEEATKTSILKRPQLTASPAPLLRQPLVIGALMMSVVVAVVGQKWVSTTPDAQPGHALEEERARREQVERELREREGELHAREREIAALKDEYGVNDPPVAWPIDGGLVPTSVSSGASMDIDSGVSSEEGEILRRNLRWAGSELSRLTRERDALRATLDDTTRARDQLRKELDAAESATKETRAQLADAEKTTKETRDQLAKTEGFLKEARVARDDGQKKLDACTAKLSTSSATAASNAAKLASCEAEVAVLLRRLGQPSQDGGR